MFSRNLQKLPKMVFRFVIDVYIGCRCPGGRGGGRGGHNVLEGGTNEKDPIFAIVILDLSYHVFLT